MVNMTQPKVEVYLLLHREGLLSCLFHCEAAEDGNETRRVVTSVCLLPWQLPPPYCTTPPSQLGHRYDQRSPM